MNWQCRDPMQCTADGCKAREVIDDLRKQVDALTNERDALNAALDAKITICGDANLAAAQARIVELREALEVARQAFVSNGDQILKDFYSEFDNRLGMSIDFKECYAEQIAGALAIPDDS